MPGELEPLHGEEEEAGREEPGNAGPKGESSSSFGSNIMNVPLFGFYVDLKSQNQGGKVTKLTIMYLLTKIFREIKKANFK